VTLRITLITGGSTPERDVALAGAAQVLPVLRALGHQVTVVDTTSGPVDTGQEATLLTPEVRSAPPDEARLARLASRELGPALVELDVVRHADLAFLVLHGRQGEGGGLQAVLDLAGVPYTGSDALGSGIAMDKDLSKRLFRDAGIPTPPWARWPVAADDLDRLGWPIIVKPSRVGSTVGLSLVETPADVEAAVREAARYDDEILLETFVPGREYTVGILDGRALAVGEIVPDHTIFDYACKYTPGLTREIFPADLSPGATAEIQDLALRAHVALNLRDFSRIDFRLGDDGIPYCLEANTLPGLTSTSLLPQSARAGGVAFDDLCDTICRCVRRRSGGAFESAVTEQSRVAGD